MAALLREVCQLHREMVPGAEIAERLSGAAMPMIGEAKLLYQLFSNLLSNAVKYSPGGGAIEVEAEMRPTRSSSPSPTAASAFPRTTWNGCSNATTAAATFLDVGTGVGLIW